LIGPIGGWGGYGYQEHGKRKYRSELFIIREILHQLKHRGGMAKTTLLGAVNLNNKNGTKYIEKLVKSGLIKQEGNLYKITAKGELALQAVTLAIALLTSNNALAENCKKKMMKILSGSRIEEDVSIYSPTGISYVFTMYIPDKKTAITVIDASSLDTTQWIYNYTLGVLNSIDPLDLAKLIIVVGNEASAHRLRTALSMSDVDMDRITVLSACDETALRMLFSVPVQAQL